MATKKIAGQLEIDAERGVIYFHSAETGITALRISGLPTPIPVDGDLLDLADVLSCSYAAADKRIGKEKP